jgi:integrase
MDSDLMRRAPVRYTNSSAQGDATRPRKRRSPAPNLDALTPAWLSDLELLGRSASTRTTYRAVLKTMLTGVSSPSELTPDRIRRIAHERLAAWRPQSVRTGVKVLQSFCSWLVSEGYLSANPVVRVPRPALALREHRILSREQTSMLWSATNNDEERLLLVLLLNGLRAGELCALRWTDVDRAHGVLHLHSTKGRRPRAIPLQPRVAQLLDSHHALTEATVVERHRRAASRARMATMRRDASRAAPIREAILAALAGAGRPLLPKEINAALNENGFGDRLHIRTLLHRMRMLGLVARCREGFGPGRGEPAAKPPPNSAEDDRIFRFGAHTLRKRVATLGLRAGIVHVHPHLLRHTFASHFRLEGGDEASLMAIGGWSSVEMARYYGRSVLGTVAMARSRELDLTEHLIGDTPAVATPLDLVERVLADPNMREQLLVRLLARSAHGSRQAAPIRDT